MLRQLILCFLSGLILSLPFANGKLWILSWFGYVLLFITIRGRPKPQAFLLSYLCGLIFWLVTIYWLAHVTLLGMLVLAAYLALYFGFFGLVVSFYPALRFRYLLLVPSIWVLLEYARSHLLTGFGWALLGYSQCLNLPVIQIAGITGAFGVSFIVMLANVLIFASLSGRKKAQLFVLFLIISVWAYGYFELRQRPPVPGLKPIKISVIQPSIVQELKWNSRARDLIINQHLRLSSQAAQANPDLIIWPEAALPVILEEEPKFFTTVKDFAVKSATPFLLGAVTFRDGLYYNSALLVSKKGSLLERYDKLHLVPFGEYIPLRNILGFLDTVVPIGDIARGEDYTVFSLRPGMKFSVLICFEDVFPGLSREFVNRGADFLVNITNDAWFKQTTAGYQHLQASIFRAVENRVYLMRAANTGISGFIDPHGKIISLVQDASGNDIFVAGYAIEEIVIPKRSTSFYTRYGDVFIAACFLFFITYGIILRHV